MTSNRSRRALPRVLAGTVLIGSLAFAAQVGAQQSGGQTQGQRQGRSAEERRPEGRGGRGERPDSAQRVERRVSMLTERLNLSATQAATIRQILLEEQTQMQTFRPRRGQRTRPDSGSRAQRPARPDSAAREQGRAQMEALRQRTRARIEGVLTSEQRTAYRELVKNRGDRRDGGPRRGGPERGGSDRGGQRTPPPVTA